MPLHLQEFQREEFQGYVESVPAKRSYKLASKFPDKPVFDTDFAYNTASGADGQMASITAWDAGAPLRDKSVLTRMTGQISKMQHGYRLTEKELLMYNRPRMEEEQKQAVDAIYNQTDTLVYGVHDRAEWLRAQATYVGELALAENGVVMGAIDFGIPEENKLGVSVAWTTASADVLGDLKTAVKQFKDANGGQVPTDMEMSGVVESLLLQSTQVKEQIFGAGSAGSRIVTSEQLNSLFTALSIPAYSVNDETVRGDDGVQRFMPEDRVVFTGANLGHTLQGPTVENNYVPGIYVIPEIQTTNPPKQEVYVGSAMFPALERPTEIVHLIVTPAQA